MAGHDNLPFRHICRGSGLVLPGNLSTIIVIPSAKGSDHTAEYFDYRGPLPAIPLMMVKLGNRYTVLANLIRHLHDEVIRDNVSPTNAERFLLQIRQPRDRLRHRHHPVQCHHAKRRSFILIFKLTGGFEPTEERAFNAYGLSNWRQA